MLFETMQPEKGEQSAKLQANRNLLTVPLERMFFFSKKC